MSCHRWGQQCRVQWGEPFNKESIWCHRGVLRADPMAKSWVRWHRTYPWYSLFMMLGKNRIWPEISQRAHKLIKKVFTKVITQGCFPIDLWRTRSLFLQPQVPPTSCYWHLCVVVIFRRREKKTDLNSWQCHFWLSGSLWKLVLASCAQVTVICPNLVIHHQVYWEIQISHVIWKQLNRSVTNKWNNGSVSGEKQPPEA